MLNQNNWGSNHVGKKMKGDKTVKNLQFKKLSKTK
jgi:hypothetical protein